MDEIDKMAASYGHSTEEIHEMKLANLWDDVKRKHANSKNQMVTPRGYAINRGKFQTALALYARLSGKTISELMETLESN